MRSATEDPCGNPASVEIMGVPFCERCAREQEEYAAIGTPTDPESGPYSLHQATLTETLRRLRRQHTSLASPRETLHRGQKV